MALILSCFFGLGICLSRIAQNRSTDGSHAGLDSFILGKTAGMVAMDVFMTAAACAGAIIVVALLHKEFRLVCFDPHFAQSLGWKVAWIDYAILTLLSLAVVLGLPMVGVVMIAALTIIPPVTARLWVRDLTQMMWLSASLAVAAAVGGVAMSAAWEGMPAGPVIVLCATILFVASALMSPSRGVIATGVRRRRMAREVSLLGRGEPM